MSTSRIIYHVAGATSLGIFLGIVYYPLFNFDKPEKPLSKKAEWLFPFALGGLCLGVATLPQKLDDWVVNNPNIVDFVP